eukprot:3919543-Pleurochrysis_carterae.AAC.2
MRVWPLIDDQVVNFVNDEHGLAELLVELAADHLAQEALVDVGLEAVANVKRLVVEVSARTKPHLGVEWRVRPMVTREQTGVVLENVYAFAV